MNTDPASEPGRLRWRCRRGTQELDLLLRGYLDNAWQTASSAERSDFVAFLELPDPDLEQYLLKDAIHPDPGARFAELAARIRAQGFGRCTAAQAG